MVIYNFLDSCRRFILSLTGDRNDTRGCGKGRKINLVEENNQEWKDLFSDL